MDRAARESEQSSCREKSRRKVRREEQHKCDRGQRLGQGQGQDGVLPTRIKMSWLGRSCQTAGHLPGCTRSQTRPLAHEADWELETAHLGSGNTWKRNIFSSVKSQHWLEVMTTHSFMAATYRDWSSLLSGSSRSSRGVTLDNTKVLRGNYKEMGSLLACL